MRLHPMSECYYATHKDESYIGGSVLYSFCIIIQPSCSDWLTFGAEFFRGEVENFSGFKLVLSH